MMFNKLKTKLQDALYLEGIILVLEKDYPSPHVMNWHLKRIMKQVEWQIAWLRFALQILSIRRRKSHV